MKNKFLPSLKKKIFSTDVFFTGRLLNAMKFNPIDISKKILLFTVFILGLLSNYTVNGQSANLDQIRNGSGTSPDNPPDYQNGNAGASNAHYAEGWSIAYRMQLDGFTAGATGNVLVIEWDTYKGGKHALDYITHYQNLDNPSGSHQNTFGHTQETVDPLEGLTASDYTSSSTFLIPAPAAPTATFFNSFTGSKLLTIYNGTITGFQYLVQDSPDGDRLVTRAAITFNLAAGKTKALIAWGGHIASEQDWGVGEGATGISGSPYHTRLISLNGAGGNQDRSLQAAAVVIPPTCSVTPSSATVCEGGTATFTASGSGGSGGAPYTFAWTGPNGYTATTAAITVGVEGTYTVIVRDKNGVGSSNNCSAQLVVNDIDPGTIAGGGTLCAPFNPAAFTSTTPGSGDGTITYQWQSNTTGCGAAFTNIVGATSETYDAPAVAVTTYFRRVATSTLNGVPCSDNSNCLTVTPNAIVPGVIAGSQTLCTPFNPAAFTSTTPGSGGGTITYQWQSNTTGCGAAFTDIVGATSETYDAPAVAVTTYFRRVATSTLNGIPCSDNSNCLTVTPNAIVPGVIAGSQTLCTPFNPAAFTSTTSGSGGGTITYQWQSNTTGCGAAFTDIVGATSETYDAPAVAVTTYFRRVATSTLNGVPCSDNSNCLTVTPNAIVPGVIAGSQTLCTPFNPAAFTSTTPGSGGGTITYQWQSNTTGCGAAFTDIVGATSETYDAPAVAVTTYFRRVATSTLNGIPCSDNSNCLTVTPNAIVPGVIAGSQTLCTPFNPAAFTSTTSGSGGGTITYQWQSNTTGCGAAFTDIVGATSETYDAPAVAVTTYFRRVATSTLNGVPCSDNSNCLTVTPNAIVPGVIAGSQTLCTPADPAAFTRTTPVSSGGAITLQVQSNPTGCGAAFTDIVGATSETYDAPTVSGATYFRRVATSTLNGVPCSANSNCLTITPEDIHPGEIAGSQTLCTPFNPAAFTSVTPGSDGGVITYQWQSNTTGCGAAFIDISGATSETYDAPAVAVTTYFRRVATSTLNGVPCSDNSNCLTVTPNAIVPGVITGNQAGCSPFDPAAFTSTTPGSGGGVITYQWQSNTTGCGAAFTDIVGATSETYDAPAVAVTTYFRRVAISTLGGVPCSNNSNCLTVTTISSVPIVLDCPEDITPAYCGLTVAQADAQIAIDFGLWLDSFGYTGGINPSLTITPANPQPPSFAVGGFIDVTWTVEGDCERDSCTRRFTVDNACNIVCAPVPTNVLCNGASTGTITVYGALNPNIPVFGGTPPYSFRLYNSSNVLIAGPQASNVFSGLAADNYRQEVGDALTNLTVVNPGPPIVYANDNRCVSNNVLITEPTTALDLLALDHTDVTCDGPNTGTITATITGGTAPYKVAIDSTDPNDRVDVTDVTPPITYTFTGVLAGPHTVTAYDANYVQSPLAGCTDDEPVTVEPPVCGGHIFPTQTACCHYISGTATDLLSVCTTTKETLVTNAIPGVFFYYSYIVAPSANFTIEVKQTNDGDLNKLFKVQNLRQVRLFTDKCENKSFTASIVNDGANAKYVITGATPGATYVVSVKYDVKSLLGANYLVYPGSDLNSTYTFGSYVNGTLDPLSVGDIDAQSGCHDDTPLPGACPGTSTATGDVSTSVAIFTAYPVPFKEYINIRYEFNYQSKARIEIFDAKGMFVMAYDDADAYFNKEVRLNTTFNQGEGQLFFVKVITDREVSTQKVVSKN